MTVLTCCLCPQRGCIRRFDMLTDKYSRELAAIKANDHERIFLIF